MNDTAKTIVLTSLKQTFPKYPVRVQESPEDSATLWVRVFAVPVDQVRAVKDFISDLEDKLVGDARVMLLPMVKNIEVTREHYPEYLPQEVTSSLSAFVEMFMREDAQMSDAWAKMTSNRVYACFSGSTIAHREFDFSSIMDAQLQPLRIQKAIIPANEQYALAA